MSRGAGGCWGETDLECFLLSDSIEIGFLDMLHMRLQSFNSAQKSLRFRPFPFPHLFRMNRAELT